jgi:hypothetical protein
MADLGSPQLDDDSSSTTDLERLIESRDHFEQAWKSGHPRRIEEELTEVEERLRPRLFQKLLELELELRRKRGDRPRRTTKSTVGLRVSNRSRLPFVVSERHVTITLAGYA